MAWAQEVKMAELSSEDKRRIEEEVAAAVAEAERAGPDTTDATAEALSIPDLQRLFCENWPKAKAALEFVIRFLPEKYKRYVRIVIVAGDKLHELICD